MNLMAPSSDLKELQAQTELFKKLKVEHDKQIKELTKGQDIAQLEARARKTLEEAKAEAATIVSNAKRGVEQVEKSKGDYQALKAKLEDSKQTIIDAKQAALKAKQDAEQAKAAAENVKAELEKECQECDKLKASLKGKVKELQEILVRFNGSLN